MGDPSTLGLRPPNIAFDDNGAVRNLDYGDIYFSPEDGRAESSYVFLDCNDLATRFAALSPGDVFTIGELGFGTGLNFLLAWELFDTHAPDGARLCFISGELHPMSGEQIARAMRPYPELEERAARLAAKMPPPLRGFHTLYFAKGRARLSLMLGDIAKTLPDAQAHVDAWFLDGFAPSKNADMWAEHVISHVARLSHAGTTFATFTAAGAVRRALAAHGFAVEKIPGHGRKREMLIGRMEAAQLNDAHNQLPAPHSGAHKAVIIGAGIAGAAAAFALAWRGWDVTVLEQDAEPANAASGNPRGAIYPKLGAQVSPATRTIANCFSSASQIIDFVEFNNFSACGALALDFTDARVKRHDGIAALAPPPALARRVDAAEASRIAGIPLDCGGLFMESAGTLPPRELCKKLLSHPNIHITNSAQASDIKQKDGEWRITDEAGETIAAAPVVVIASGAALNALKPLQWLPIEHVRGQITQIPTTPTSKKLKCVLNHKGYIIPAEGDQHVIGATFDKHSDTPDIHPQDNAENIATLAKYVPVLAGELSGLDTDALPARAGVRVAVNDRLPLAGPCPDYQRFLKTHAPLRKGQAVDTPAPLHEGLFVTGAHGSHGLTTAPLCGELIAAMVTGDPLPIELSLYEYLMPVRLVLRGLKRGEI